MAGFSCLELPPPNVSPLPNVPTQTLSLSSEVSQLNRSGSVSVSSHANANANENENANELFVQESPKTYAALFTYPSPPPSSPFSAVGSAAAVSPFSAANCNECQLDLNMAFENARSPFAAGSEVDADA